ncbi:hypothetical protein EV582_4115 [Duganella sp. BK701]|uniref:hypothetical protein n=1 Tax=unclassified Duganella TaxID=2636909 RepID=UPI000AF241AD|nr:MULTISPECIES: hypothetical protein [unclassified Duganella]RZT05796.1 hypothetical protein EV582_4115 [Duganella sp. BK701]
MSNLQKILEQAKLGLKPWEPIPQAQWQAIAAGCGQEEFQDIERRIQKLKNELAETPDWDGDTQDDINSALWFFKSLLESRPA